MHSGSNRNRSNVTDDALTKASKTLAYKPILANFMEYVDEEGNVLSPSEVDAIRYKDDYEDDYYR